MNETALPKIKILIADDHQVLLDGLISLLQKEKNIELAAKAIDGKQVIEILEQKHFDICLLDISMPGMDGMETAKWIIQHRPAVKIIVLTTHDEEEIIAEMIHTGVMGYLLKSCTRQELLDCIARVMNGKTYFSEKVSNTILESYARGLRKQLPEPVLTPRESEIVKLLANEYTNERIAKELDITFRTVETHRRNIMQKTKANNLAGLIKYAFSKGLIK